MEKTEFIAARDDLRAALKRLRRLLNQGTSNYDDGTVEIGERTADNIHIVLAKNSRANAEAMHDLYVCCLDYCDVYQTTGWGDNDTRQKPQPGDAWHELDDDGKSKRVLVVQSYSPKESADSEAMVQASDGDKTYQYFACQADWRSIAGDGKATWIVDRTEG